MKIFHLMIAFSLITSSALAQGRHQTIVQTGDALPDGNGMYSVFKRISDLNNAGHFGSVTFIEGGSTGQLEFGTVYFDGTMNVLARTEAPAPGGGTVSSVDFVMNNENSQALFYGRTDPGNVFSAFLGDGASVDLVWNEDQIAPNGDTYLSFLAMNLDDSGKVYYSSTTDTGSVTRSGIFGFEIGASPAILVQSGDAAPDGNGVFANTAHGGSYSAFLIGRNNERSAGVNSRGAVVFWGDLTNTSGGSTDDAGIFLMDDVSLSQIVRRGQASPDGDGTFSDFNSHYEIDINENDSVMFWSFLNNSSGGSASDFGIFMHQDNALKLVVREGQVSPDSNGTYLFFWGLELNDLDQVLFTSELAGTAGGTIDSIGLFRASDNGVVQLARTGDIIPDGTATLGADGPLSPIRSTQINHHGQAVYLAYITELTESSHGFIPEGVFVSDGIETLQVARSGELIDGVEIVDANRPNEPGFNDLGQVLYSPMLIDNTELVRIWTPDLHWRNSVDGDWQDNLAWTLGIEPRHVHDVFVDPDVDLSVDGPLGNEVVRTLQIGGGNGVATLKLQPGSVLQVINGLDIESNGVVSGDGDIGGSVVSQGTISPGSSAGKLVFSDLTLDPGSSIVFELGGLPRGTGYDAIDIQNLGHLNGTLTVVLINSFPPAINDTFLLIQADSLTGDFANVVLPTLDPGMHWTVLQDVDSLSLVVEAEPTGPFGDKFLDGEVAAGQLSNVVDSDDTDYELAPAATANPIKQKIDLILLAESPTASPNSFSFALEAAMTGGPSGDVIQTIELWNEQAAIWEVFDSRPASTTDLRVRVDAVGDLTRFVHPLTDEIIAKVRWESPEFAGATFSWSIDVDQAAWLID